MTRAHLIDLVPPALADNPPPRGPSLRERRRKLVEAVRHAPHLSDRTLAAWCGVSRELVKTIRGEMVACGAIVPQATRLGGDGKRYRVKQEATP